MRNQIYLGNDELVEDMQREVDPDHSLKDVLNKHKQAPLRPLSYCASEHRTRNEAMASAYLSGHYTLQQVGAHFGVSYATVSRAVKQVEVKRLCQT